MRLLALFAHPDDESYGPGATLARCADRGDRVHLVTFTRGTASKIGPEQGIAPEEIGRVRTRELQRAAAALGIGDLKIGDLPDKGLADIPHEEGVQLVRDELERVAPDTVITFHPDGISGHPDHRAVSRWVTAAIPDGIRLLYFGVPQSHADMLAGQREMFPMSEDEITHRIPVGEFRDAKMAAIRCHASQLALWDRLEALGIAQKYFGVEECFAQVRPEIKTADSDIEVDIDTDVEDGD